MFIRIRLIHWSTSRFPFSLLFSRSFVINVSNIIVFEFWKLVRHLSRTYSWADFYGIPWRSFYSFMRIFSYFVRHFWTRIDHFWWNSSKFVFSKIFDVPRRSCEWTHFKIYLFIFWLISWFSFELHTIRFLFSHWLQICYYFSRAIHRLTCTWLFVVAHITTFFVTNRCLCVHLCVFVTFCSNHHNFFGEDQIVAGNLSRSFHLFTFFNVVLDQFVACNKLVPVFQCLQSSVTLNFIIVQNWWFYHHFVSFTLLVPQIPWCLDSNHYFMIPDQYTIRLNCILTSHAQPFLLTHTFLFFLYR